MQVSNSEEISEEFAAVAQAIKFMHFAIDKTKPTLESGICTKLQQAVSELTPSFANIAIAVRELLKIRLLVPSQILVRTLLDRLATISYERTETPQFKNGIMVGRQTGDQLLKKN
jgi:hypothetical protein